MSNHNPFIWQEVVTSDQETSDTFYSKLPGWRLKKVDAGKFGTYTLIQKDGQNITGRCPLLQIRLNKAHIGTLILQQKMWAIA